MKTLLNVFKVTAFAPIAFGGKSDVAVTNFNFNSFKFRLVEQAKRRIDRTNEEPRALPQSGMYGGIFSCYFTCKLRL